MKIAVFKREIKVYNGTIALIYELSREDETLMYSLMLKETHTMTNRTICVVAPEFTESPEEAIRVAQMIADGTVTSDTFFDIFEDFFA